MSKVILLAACCVLVVACLIYTADGADVPKAQKICRKNCLDDCKQKHNKALDRLRRTGKGGPRKQIDDAKRACDQGCENRLRFCAACTPRTFECTKCMADYRPKGKLCIAIPPPAATTPTAATTTLPAATAAAVDPCSSNPCQNSGTCTGNADGTYTCACDSQWTGAICDTAVNPCNPNPCNGGTCVSGGSGTYTCTCLDTTTTGGTNCEITCSGCSSTQVCTDVSGTGTCQ